MKQPRKPAHVVRATTEACKTSRRKPPAPAAKHYRPGYFTEPVRAENGATWPPGWEPHSEPLKTATEYHLDAARELALQRGVGFARNHTLTMPGTPPKRGRPRNQEGGY